MTLRNGHGTGAGVPRIEVLPADEQAAPVPAVPDPVTRRQNGTVADSASAKLLGSRGGARRSARARLASTLGLADLAKDSAFAPSRELAEEFVRAHLAELARMGGGDVGPGPSSIVASAGLQLAASRFLAGRAAANSDAALFQASSRLANDSRQNLLAAYELAIREAKARPQPNSLDVIRRRILNGRGA